MMKTFESQLGPIFQPYHNNRTVADMIRPEMDELMDPYWHQFSPMESKWYGILAVFVSCAAMVSISGNLTVIYIFSTTKYLRTPSNTFIVNLAISDLFMFTFMFPPLVVNCYYETWVWGPFMCQIYALFGSLFGCVSIWSMCLIAFDRYYVIVKGIAGKPLTTNQAIVQIIGIWIFSFLWVVFPILGWARYVPEGNMTACGTDYLSKDFASVSYLVTYSIACYYLPFAVICYAYYYIIKAVCLHEKSMRDQAKKMNVASLRSTEDANKNVEIRLAMIALYTITLWFIAWTPYLVINWLGMFEALDLSPSQTIWGSVFAKCNAVYNPIIYALSHPKYRTALAEKFLSGGKEWKAGSDVRSTRTETTIPNA